MVSVLAKNYGTISASEDVAATPKNAFFT